FSCKEQIAQQTDRHALHLAEVLEMGLRPDMSGQTVLYPERQFVEARKTALNRSMMRAGLITLSALAITVAGLFWWKSRRRRAVVLNHVWNVQPKSLPRNVSDAMKDLYHRSLAKLVPRPKTIYCS